MMRLYISAVAALVLGATGHARATNFTPADCTPGNVHFCLNGDAAAPDVDPYITAMFTNSFRNAQAVDDTFLFTIDKSGVASGAVQTTFSSKGTYLTLTDMIINGVSYASLITNSSAGASVKINDIPIIGGALNSIRIVGTFAPPANRGQANYIGNLTFTAAIPEASLWAMMIVGFGMLGAGLRGHRLSLRASGNGPAKASL